jgi:poly-beta-hydroxybutyrate-responsive repressor
MLEPALLLLLHVEEAHGYTLLMQLEEFGLAALDPSVVYRTLRDLEECGLVSSVWDEEESQGPPRRVYRVTAEGDQVLGQWVKDLRDARDRLDHLLERYERHMEEGVGEHH